MLHNAAPADAGLAGQVTGLGVRVRKVMQAGSAMHCGRGPSVLCPWNGGLSERCGGGGGRTGACGCGRAPRGTQGCGQPLVPVPLPALGTWGSRKNVPAVRFRPPPPTKVPPPHQLGNGPFRPFSGIRLTSKDGTLALIPWADMLNHAPTVRRYLDWEQDEGAVCFRADRSYNVGEEVFVSYGPRSSGELLLSYGFVPRNRKLQAGNEKVGLSLQVNPNDAFAGVKTRCLLQHGYTTPHIFPLQLNSFPQVCPAFDTRVGVVLPA